MILRHNWNHNALSLFFPIVILQILQIFQIFPQFLTKLVKFTLKNIHNFPIYLFFKALCGGHANQFQCIVQVASYD
jgi:hypothetical protein